MADSTNNINLQVTNGVDPGIAPRLIQVADASERAEKSVASLKGQLASLQASGLGTLLSQLSALQGAVASVGKAQDTAATQTRVKADAATAAVAKQTAASQAQARASATLAAQTDLEAAAYVQLADATIAVQTAKANLSGITKTLADSTVGEQETTNLLAAAMVQQKEATNQLVAAKANLAEVTAFLNEQANQTLLVTEEGIAAAKEQQIAYIQSIATGTMKARLEEEMGLLFRQNTLAETAQTIATERQTAATAAEAIAITSASEATVENTVANEVNTQAMNASAVAGEGVAESGRRITNAFYAAQGASRLMSGQIPIRAFERFIASSSALSSILLKAFPIIGAIALVEVLFRAGKAMYELILKARDAGREIARAFDEVIGTLRKHNDELAFTNDKLDATIATLSHKPRENGLVMALDEARVMADKLDESLEGVSRDLEQILKKNSIGLFGSLFTGQATTGSTQKFVEAQFNAIYAAKDKATAALDDIKKITDPKQADAALQTAYQTERTAIQTALANLQSQYNATEKLKDQAKRVTVNTPYGPSTMTVGGEDQTANLTILGKSAHLAQAELRGLDLEMDNLAKNKAADKLRDNASELRGAAKAAKEEWRQLEADFVKFQSDMDKAGHKPTAQENLAFLVGKESDISAANRDKLAAKELPFRNQIASQTFYEDEIAKLKDRNAEIGLYDDELKITAQLDRIIEDAQRRHITLTEEQTATLRGLIQTQVENQKYGSELEAIYRSVNDPIDTYHASIKALDKALHDGVITQQQFSDGLRQVTKIASESMDAVTKFRNEFADSQRDQENMLGSQLHQNAQQTLNQLDSQLRQPGVDSSHPFGYNPEEIAKINQQLRPMIEQTQRKNAVDQQSNQLIHQQGDLMDQLKVKRDALTKAVQAGAMTQEAANSEMIRGAIQQNDQNLSNGTSTKAGSGAMLDYLKNFTTIAKGIKDVYSSTFRTIADGAADAFGRAIAYGQNLGTALKSVARDAIGELISGLIKLGIQQVLNMTIGAAAASAATAVGVAQATTMATAWAPAAFAASVASFGMADAVGGTAYATGLAAAIALNAVPKLSVGTNYLPGDMLIQAHEGERVIPKADNQQLMAMLDNNGGKTSGSSDMNVEVHNYNGSRVQVEHMDENKVRLIVRDEAPGLVAKHGPGVIATDLSNPNSRTSKALSRSTYSTRRR